MLAFLTGRVARVAAQAAVLTAVVGGTVAYAHQSKSITLVLDGATATVQADADDVRELLADEGVRVSPRDAVVPDLDAPLHAGERVVVRFARPLSLTVDGAPRTYWTTELTVADALRSLGIREEGARLSVSRSQPLGRSGLDLVVSHPKAIRIVADGRSRDVTTTASTVQELLAERGVTVRAADEVSAAPSSPLADGEVVAVTRIEHRRVTVTEALPPRVVQKPTDALPKGEKRTLVPGRAGTQRAVYEVVLADGRPSRRTALSAVVVKPAVARVVQVGTRDDAADRSVTGADGLNWAALARCESGGNPRAVNAAGYYGLYQFSRGTWRAVGGSGLPSDASPAEQLYRAKLLFARGGAGQWGCGRHLYD